MKNTMKTCQAAMTDAVDIIHYVMLRHLDHNLFFSLDVLCHELLWQHRDLILI